MKWKWLSTVALLLAAAQMPFEMRVQAAPVGSEQVRTYKVGRKVAEFGTNEDLSTPEAAYAAIHRAYAAEGNAAWARLSVPELARRLPVVENKPLPAKEAERWLNAEVLEATVYFRTNATVFATMKSGGVERVDIRWFRLHGRRWLNNGNDVRPNLVEARKAFARSVGYLEAQSNLSSRPEVADPPKHLARFVEFLQKEGKDPESFLLNALGKHRLVILGEVHHRPLYWDLNARLVRSLDFASRVGVIYLELPLSAQGLVDEFLGSPAYNPQLVIEVLRDMLWMGWPDQPMLDFFKAVWEMNSGVPKEKRVRVVLVDMPRPWKEIRQRSDWRKYEVDRDAYMAQEVNRDLSQNTADSRYGLFIVGYAHAMLNLTHPGGEPMKSAGWHLRQKLGEANVFAVFPHSPVMSNNGQTRGRIALGLFETAFAALTNRPVAFPLDHGPFGELIFDAAMDRLTGDRFKDGYSAYLYLGPLEDETMSPAIAGFYTDEFAAELDRRSRVTFGEGLVEGHGIKKVDGDSVMEWMSRSWGQPRKEWSVSQLGPINAWEMGSDWKQKRTARMLAELRQGAAKPDADQKSRLIAQVEEFFRHNFHDIKGRETIEWGECGKLTNGLAAIRYQYTGRVWGKESVTNNQVFVFDASGNCLSVENVP